MYKVEVKKAGQFDFEKVDLNIVEQEQLNILVSKFLSADFETREKMLKQIKENMNKEKTVVEVVQDLNVQLYEKTGNDNT